MSHLHVLQNRVTPVEAEIWFTPNEPGVLTGRLHGPKCRYATTVEIGFALHPVRGQEGTFRTVIPEPSLWDPESPFLYEGTLVLTNAKGNITRHFVRQGLRMVRESQGKLLVNGKPFEIRGMQVHALDVETALALRGEGSNVLHVADSESVETILEIADEVGFFVVVENVQSEPERIARWWEHPSCLATFSPGEPNLVKRGLA